MKFYEVTEETLNWTCEDPNQCILCLFEHDVLAYSRHFSSGNQRWAQHVLVYHWDSPRRFVANRPVFWPLVARRGQTAGDQMAATELNVVRAESLRWPSVLPRVLLYYEYLLWLDTVPPRCVFSLVVSFCSFCGRFRFRVVWLRLFSQQYTFPFAFWEQTAGYSPSSTKIVFSLAHFSK